MKIDFAKDILFQNGRLRRKLKMFRLEEKDRDFFDSFFVPKKISNFVQTWPKLLQNGENSRIPMVFNDKFLSNMKISF